VKTSIAILNTGSRTIEVTEKPDLFICGIFKNAKAPSITNIEVFQDKKTCAMALTIKKIIRIGRYVGTPLLNLQSIARFFHI